jgi:hypothetical protein
VAATIGKVSAVFSASTAGLRSGVNDAIRSIRQLGGEAGTLKGLFDRLQLTAGLDAAGPAAEKAGASLARFQRLAALAQESLAAGRITAEQFAAKMALIGEAAERSAAVFARGAAITQQFETEEEKAARTVAELNNLLGQGAISQETFASAMADATGAAAQQKAQMDAARAAADAQTKAADELARVMARGATFAQQFETAEEGANRKIGEATDLFNAGAISLDTYTRAINAATTDTDALKAAAAAERSQLEAAARQMDAFSATLNEGAAVASSVATAEERHAAEVQRLKNLLAAGAISQETYTRAVAKSEKEVRGTASASRTLGSATASAAAGVDKLAGKLNTLIAINAAQLFGSITGAVSRAASSLFGMAKSQADVIDRASDLSTRLGLNYGELAGITAIGAQVGVGMDQIAKAATKADVAFAKAAGGSALAVKAFDAVGLSVDELQGMNASERFNAIAAAIAKLPTPAERARAAVGLFGKAGAELLPIFENGAASIEQATRDAERFGLALTNDQGKSVNEMDDAFVRAGQAIQGVIGQVVAHLSPALKAVADTFSNLIGDIGGATIGQVIGEQLMAGAEFLATIADGMVASVGGVWEYVAGVGEYWGAVFTRGGQIASMFAAGGRLLSAAFQTVVLGLGTIVEKVLSAAKQLADLIPGMSSSGLDSAVAGAQAFNAELRSGITANMAAAAQNFDAATNPATTAAAVKGPIATAVADAVEAARRNAAAKDAAAPVQTITPKAAEFGPSTAALKGTDSRSREGIAEMFRLMRGDTGDVAQEQLEVQKQIRDALSEPDLVEELAMGG